ncbi:hypothetical protein ADEAN_000105000 [Angomonas deanei]|uniref:Uncharacterized protein n=1 Tax=Angomonas deanei TaxID=59799 RepID=A0A7G2C4E2_9TRYP|nr:hypothetical protein ADEAN_000105000 [Angomonas deanei]
MGSSPSAQDIQNERESSAVFGSATLSERQPSATEAATIDAAAHLNQSETPSGAPLSWRKRPYTTGPFPHRAASNMNSIASYNSDGSYSCLVNVLEIEVSPHHSRQGGIPNANGNSGSFDVFVIHSCDVSSFSLPSLLTDACNVQDSYNVRRTATAAKVGNTATATDGPSQQRNTKLRPRQVSFVDNERRM